MVKKPRKMQGRSYLAWVVAIVLVAVFVGVSTAVATSPVANLPPEKAALWNRIQQEIIDARADAPPKPKASDVVLPPSEPYPTRVAGIFETHQGPFSNINFSLNNMWEGPVGTDWVQAYAGAEHPVTAPLTQKGALRLDRLDLTNGNTEIIGIFDAPTGQDAVTITGVKGTVLNLRSDSGQTLTFDLQTHLYQ